MAIEYSKILKKGLQSNIDSATSLDDCVLKFTTDTLRMYIEDGSSRLEITNVIYGMTEAEIKNSPNWLPKLYVASDTLAVFISDGTDLEPVSKVIPVEIESTDEQTYYPIMKSESGDNTKGYSSGLSYTPSSKLMQIGDMKISQVADEEGYRTVDIFF